MIEVVISPEACDSRLFYVIANFQHRTRLSCAESNRVACGGTTSNNEKGFFFGRAPANGESAFRKYRN